MGGNESKRDHRSLIIADGRNRAKHYQWRPGDHAVSAYRAAMPARIMAVCNERFLFLYFRSPMKIAVAQLNPILGDLAGNAARILAEAERAKAARATLLLAPELALCGYPPEDLLFRHDFRDACAAALTAMAARVQGISIVVGHPHLADGKLYNAASLLEQGRIVGTYRKQRLPNYQVFDELRYFATGDAPFVFEHAGVKIGVLICEDVWFAEPVAATRAAGAQLIVVPNASPYDFRKLGVRYDAVKARVSESRLPILYAHMTGGQDELVFDGASFGINADGSVGYQEREFEEALGLVSFEDSRISREVHSTLPTEASVYPALVVAF